MPSLVRSLMVAAGLALFAWALARSTAPVAGPSRFDDGASEFRITAPRFVEFGAEGPRMTADGVEATYNQRTNRIMARSIHARLLRQGRRTEVWANRGEYNLESTTASLSGGIRIENDQGYRFLTEAAEFSNEQRLITASGPFTSTGNGLTLRGAGLRYHLDEDAFEVEHNVGASIERTSF